MDAMINNSDSVNTATASASLHLTPIQDDGSSTTDIHNMAAYFDPSLVLDDTVEFLDPEVAKAFEASMPAEELNTPPAPASAPASVVPQALPVPDVNYGGGFHPGNGSQQPSLDQMALWDPQTMDDIEEIIGSVSQAEEEEEQRQQQQQQQQQQRAASQVISDQLSQPAGEDTCQRYTTTTSTTTATGSKKGPAPPPPPRPL